MNREDVADELDRNIGALMETGAAHLSDADALVQIAAELRTLPGEHFKQALKSRLMEQAEAMRLPSSMHRSNADALPPNGPEFMPTFSQREYGALPADPRSLLLSFTSHAAVVALIASGIWVGHQTIMKNRPLISEVTFAPMPAGDNTPHGGGSGGDHSLTQASRGTPPKFAEQQLAPPAIVVRTENPKLPAPATVLGPPELKLPQSNQIGDLMSSNVAVPSNGTGGRSGMGDNSGTGVGGGRGPGVGPGLGGGFGGETYRPGNGVSAPRAIYNPDPEYSDEARRVKFQGNVVLSLIVDPTGHVRDIHVARSLGLGLDEKAIEAVQQWKFSPGMKDGHPVAVQVNIEVNFRLY
jgi:periplasmic protein TonB